MRLTAPLERRAARLPGNVTAALDPLVSSGTMFLVQLALLLTSSKADYGFFTLMMSYVIMGQAMFSSVLGPPLISVIARQAEGQAETIGFALRWGARIALALAAIGFAACMLAFGGREPLVAAALPLVLIGLLFRDLQRIIWAIEKRLPRALVGSLILSAVTAAGLAAGLIAEGRVSPAWGFGALAIGLAAANGAGLLAALRASGSGGGGGDLVRDIRPLVTWSFPGAVVIWVQNNLFLTIVVAFLGLAQAGEISAGRMAAVPYMVAVSGVVRVLQVRFAAPTPQANARLLGRWTAGHLAFGLLAAAAGLLAGPPMAAHGLVPAKYPMIFELAGLWLLFAGVTAARSGWSSLLQARGSYRQIFAANLAILPVVIGGIVVLVPAVGVNGAILPMIAAELLLLVACAIIAHRAAPVSPQSAERS